MAVFWTRVLSETPNKTQILSSHGMFFFRLALENTWPSYANEKWVFIGTGGQKTGSESQLHLSLFSRKTKLVPSASWFACASCVRKSYKDCKLLLQMLVIFQ